MPKGPLKRMLEALTATSSTAGSTSDISSAKKEPDFGETLSKENFQPCKLVRHGFPNRPTALAYDPVQKLLAIGCHSGSIRILGQPGVDCYVTHETEHAVIQLLFLANQGALISVCANNSLHLWNLRQKKPAILHSLKFKRENITHCHIPYQSSWIFVGTDMGNTHICNVESFSLSGYSIYWNKAIEPSHRDRPGHVVSISENPIDENKVLIAFEYGIVVLWDLKNRSSEQRYHCQNPVRYCCWHYEGRSFMCSHENGSLTTWNVRNTAKPQQEHFPHAKNDKDKCRPIERVEWLACRNSEPFVIFAGGMSYSLPGRPSITLMKGKASITVLEVQSPIVDFKALVSTPWSYDFQDPETLVILSDKELVVVDLESPGYPMIKPGHPLDVDDSPVTCLKYIPDPNTDLIPGLYQVAASKPQREETSKKEWPITGGEWSVDDCNGIPEIFVTGHADGTLRFWDASAVFLKAIYKLRTKKIFKKEDEIENDEDDPFQITNISLCPESRTLVVSNVSSTITVYKLNMQETQTEINVLNIAHVNETTSSLEQLTIMNGQNPLAETKEETPQILEPDSNKMDAESKPESITKQESNSSNTQCSFQPIPMLRIKSGLLRESPGFHVDFVCLLLGNEVDPPSSVTYLAINTSHQLLTFGTTSSLCVVDMLQKACLFSMSTDAILMSIDKRIQPRSPNRLKTGFSESSQNSFSFDQVALKSPTATEPSSNGPNHHAPASHHLSSNQKSLQRELSNSSSGSAPTSGQRIKKPSHRVYKKTASFSFEKSLESATSVDDSPFSRASSLSDTERSFPREIVTFLTFANTYTKKSDNLSLPCIWVGTNGGYLFNILINLPLNCEQRSTQLMVVSPSGTLFQLKSSVVHCAFLNSSGQPMSVEAGNWREQPCTAGGCTQKCESPDTTKERINTTTVDKQFMIVCAERSTKIFTLPSQVCIHAINFSPEIGQVMHANVDTVLQGTYLVCYSFNGYILVYGLPSLNLLLESPYLPANDVRISNTFCFALNGQAIYLASHSEIQRITYSVDTFESVQEVVGHLFIPCQSPERPNPGFFKGLFGGGHSVLDREELFGESRSGKASRAVAQHIPGTGGTSLEGLRTASTGLSSEMQRLRMAAQERGEKLSELDDKTQRMHDSALKFSSDAHALMLKYKNKKWYQM